MPHDQEAQKFNWHIGGHACFQAIMHIVTELDAAMFKGPGNESLRSRALGVLEKIISIRQREASPAWNAINRIIANCLAKNSATAPSHGFNFPNEGVPGSTDCMNSDSVGGGVGSVPGGDLWGLGSLDVEYPSMGFDWVSMVQLSKQEHGNDD